MLPQLTIFSQVVQDGDIIHFQFSKLQIDTDATVLSSLARFIIAKS